MHGALCLMCVYGGGVLHAGPSPGNPVPSRLRVEAARDQLDVFLADYAKGAAKPPLPAATSSYGQPSYRYRSAGAPSGADMPGYDVGAVMARHNSARQPQPVGAAVSLVS